MTSLIAPFSFSFPGPALTVDRVKGASDTVRRFSAAGDGTTDDTAALQAAFNAGVGNLGTGLTYLISSTLTVPAGLRVHGASTIRVATPESGDAATALDLGDNCTVDGITIVGDYGDTLTDAATGCGIRANGVKNVIVANCRISHCRSCGVAASDSYNVTVSSCVIHSNKLLNWSMGDIVVWSSTGGGRVVIVGNQCLSDNSQGIYVSGVGNDTDVVVASNICVTLDPNTLSPIVTPTRRHGIILHYSGGTTSRLVCSGNICGNTAWTGIYAPNTASKSLVISGNYCWKNGLNESSGLQGGIVANAQFVIVIGNLIEDFAGSFYALQCQGGQNDGAVLIEGNIIRSSASAGMVIANNAKNVSVKNNTFVGNVGHDIFISPNAGDATLANIEIIGNRFIRTSIGAALRLYRGNSTRIITLKDNRIEGCQTAHPDVSNNGFWIQGDPSLTIVEGNECHDCYWGIYLASYPASPRGTDIVVRRNYLKDCVVGIIAYGGSADQTTPLEGNVFANCGTDFSAGGLGYSAGRDVIRHGLVWEICRQSAIPTQGTYAIGDFCRFTAPVNSGGTDYAEAYCTVAGSPGTWKYACALLP